MTNDMQKLMYEIHKLNETLNVFKPVYRMGEEQGWKFEEANKKITFYQTRTLLTTPNTVNLNIPYPFQLNRIDLSFLTAGTPSANAKTMSFRVYSGVSPATYTELRLETANTDTSMVIQAGVEYNYKAGSKLSVVFSSFTNNDTVEIALAIEKII